ncbi:hypothetical protein ACH5RR_012148 [Cinchona calisaya]|uniref:Uncharacterized protein n=1 Tax=Cinchona calisaya TaxID=153742 RepID=A0ABD3AAI7_9GENT
MARQNSRNIFGFAARNISSEKEISTDNRVKTFGWAAGDPSGVFYTFQFTRRHEIVGIVTEVDSKAWGLKVTVISTSPSKKEEAINHLGADSFLVSTDQEQMQAAKPAIGTLDGRKMLGTSAVGGVKETQEMIDSAAKHNITADIEVISMDYINKALERLEKGDVRYRFVIDIGHTLVATPST